ncbi:curli assembly protein CsgF [Pelagibacterium luteolum]|uniref:Curli production assembly/transport component CsgF n=1 Tax=Pelagibacterium luteolum TaxID=440168 RepID=A0A1G7SVP8_9HYPH|nr:curli assembly protein CsgF [Pelagibacterium luteolum]SDG27135.1 curli production assembly/transport component CsgF [Pelagibacterium luteolum]
MKISRISLATAAILVSAPAMASSMVYAPVNPSFGGDPLNGAWLLSQATAQTPGAGAPSFAIDFPDLGLIGGGEQPVDEDDATAEE